MKILIIEDEKILSEMYRLKFAKDGYQVLNALDVKEGLDLAKSEKPDLIILDILCPKKMVLNFWRKGRV